MQAPTAGTVLSVFHRPDGPSEPSEPSALVPNDCDDERALAPAYIAFEMENLLPGPEHELSIRDRYGQGRTQ